jgi:hypothetical protein
MYTLDALNFSLQRFYGKKDLLNNTLLQISNYKDNSGTYTLGISNNIEFDEVLNSLKKDELFDTLKSKSFNREIFEDVFYIMEVFLRVFKFNPSFYINDRLKNFSYVNIILNNLKGSDTKQIDNHFKNILFFNPCSEEFIERNQLIQGKYFNNGIFIDFSSCFEEIFEEIFKLKKDKIAYKKIAEKNIKQLYFFLQELMGTFFKTQPTKIPADYLKFENIFKNKKELYNSILKSIDYFSLINNETNEKIFSLYYQSDQQPEFLNLSKKNSKRKFKSEYIIDSYIYRFSDQPDEFINFLAFLKMNDYQKYIKFSIILFSHPFIIYSSEVKKILIESSIDKILPEDGYSVKKLRKYKEIFTGRNT